MSHVAQEVLTLSEHLSTLRLLVGSYCSIFVFCVCFVGRCLSFSFLFWPLCYFSFLDSRLLIIFLVSSNFTYENLSLEEEALWSGDVPKQQFIEGTVNAVKFRKQSFRFFLVIDSIIHSNTIVRDVTRVIHEQNSWITIFACFHGPVFRFVSSFIAI